MTAAPRLEAVPPPEEEPVKEPTRFELARQRLLEAETLASEAVDELQDLLGRVARIANEIAEEKKLYPAGLTEACRKLADNAQGELQRVQQTRGKK